MNHNTAITIYLSYAELFWGLWGMKKRFLPNLKFHNLLSVGLSYLVTSGNQKGFISVAEQLQTSLRKTKFPGTSGALIFLLSI